MSERNDEAERGERLAIEAESAEAVARMARGNAGQVVAEPSADRRRSPGRARAPKRDERPTMRIETGEPHQAVSFAIEALQKDADLFQRDETLVHVTRVSEEELKRIGRKLATALGTPRIVPMALATLHVRITAQ